MKLTKHDVEAIEFLHDRLIRVYKESYNVDFLINARKVISILYQQVNGVEQNQDQALNLADVNGWLSIKECAALYGKKVKCKWLSPDGNDWLNRTITVNANFLREMEQGSIKEACR